MMGRICLLLVLAGPVLGLAGCALRMGSKTIARDRFDYANAITTLWKDQMLLDTVKVRYVDPPVFLDVQQIVAQYTFEATGTINAPHWMASLVAPLPPPQAGGRKAPRTPSPYGRGYLH